MALSLHFMSFSRPFETVIKFEFINFWIQNAGHLITFFFSSEDKLNFAQKGKTIKRLRFMVIVYSCNILLLAIQSILLNELCL